MPSIIERLPGEPIVIVTLTEDYDFAAEIDTSIQEGAEFIDSLDESIHIIMDFSKVTFDISSLIAGANMSARGNNPIFHHHNTCSVSYVTQSTIVSLAARGMDSKAFGHLKIKVFGTLDEALAYVRALD